MTKKHARLGPSAAHRWMKCPASVRFCEGVSVPETPSMREGTAAHTLAERSLESNLRDASPFKGAMMPNGVTVSDAMIRAVNVYLNTVLDLAAGTMPSVEQWFDLSYLHPELAGTCDAIFSVRDVLHVLDYKHGTGHFVDAEGNPQLRLYGLGALGSRRARGCTSVCITVVQPRISGGEPVRSETLPIVDLFEWGEDVVRPAAAATDDPNAPFVPGEHCKFCPRKADCKAFEAAAHEAVLQDFDVITVDDPTAKLKPPAEFAAKVASLTSAELGRRIPTARLVDTWAKAIIAEGRKRALAGTPPAGHKLVEGPKQRVWRDGAGLEALVAALDLGADDLMRAAGVGAVERASGLPKKTFDKLADPFISREASSPWLVPVSDRRPEVDPLKLLGFEVVEAEDVE